MTTDRPESPAPDPSSQGGALVVLAAEEQPTFWSSVPGAMGACDEGGTVIVDLAGVSFLDSLAVGHLVTASRRDGVRLVLAGMRPEIFEVFKVTRLDELFTIRETASAARKEFG